MQLEFVNISGAEPWKNKEAKKLVRSRAMKDFRRRQRESAAKLLIAEMAQSIPAFDTNDHVNRLKSGLRDQVIVTKACEPASGVSTLTLDLSTNRSSSPHRSTQPSSNLELQLADFDSNFANVQIAQEFFPLPTLHSYLGISNPPNPELQQWQSSLQVSQQTRLGPQLPLTFDTRLSILADTVFHKVEGGLCNIVTNYLKTTHTWLCMIHGQRFLYHLTNPSARLDAEFTLQFLAMYLASPASMDFRDGKDDNTFLEGVYHSVKELYRIRAAQGPHFLMVISGILIALYEICHADNTAARATLQIATITAHTLGLDSTINYTMSCHQNGTLSLEECRRVWWGLIIVDRLATLAHPQNRHHPFVVKTPEIDVLLPTTIDDDPVYSDDFDLVAGLTLPVLTLIPPDADGMCREAQAAYFLSQVYDLTSQELIPTHGILISRILTLDQDIQKVFARLLRDSKGQRFCGPISLCLCSLFMLHWCQLQKTRNHRCEICQQAAIMSQLALEKTIQIVVDILRSLNRAHLVELSPSACFVTFQSAMLYLELAQLADEVGTTTALGQSDFDLIYDSLKDFATIWHNCGQSYNINLSGLAAEGTRVTQGTGRVGGKALSLQDLESASYGREVWYDSFAMIVWILLLREYRKKARSLPHL